MGSASHAGTLTHRGWAGSARVQSTPCTPPASRPARGSVPSSPRPLGRRAEPAAAPAGFPEVLSGTETSGHFQAPRPGAASFCASQCEGGCIAGGWHLPSSLDTRAALPLQACRPPAGRGHIPRAARRLSHQADLLHPSLHRLGAGTAQPYSAPGDTEDMPGI